MLAGGAAEEGSPLSAHLPSLRRPACLWHRGTPSCTVPGGPEARAPAHRTTRSKPFLQQVTEAKAGWRVEGAYPGPIHLESMSHKEGGTSIPQACGQGRSAPVALSTPALAGRGEGGTRCQVPCPGLPRRCPQGFFASLRTDTKAEDPQDPEFSHQTGWQLPRHSG